MRKALTIFCLFIAAATMGQTEKGSIIFNFDGYFQHSSSQSHETYFGQTNLKLGYAFLNNLFLGVQYSPLYGVGVGNRAEIQIQAYGLFTRYYILKNKNRFYLQTDFLHTNDGTFGWNDKWNVGVGIDHFVSKNVAIEAYYNYNFYNRSVYYSSSSVTNNGDPVLINRNKPERGTLNFGVKFLLPYGKEKINKQSRTPLADRYLKKGNRNIELAGKMGFDLPDFGYLIAASKSRFIADRLVLQHRIFGFGGINFGGWIRQSSEYNMGLRPYFSISDKLYFSPSFGLGPTFYSNNEYGSKYLGWSGEAQVAFTQFFKTWKASVGITGIVSGYFKNNLDGYNLLYAFASSNIFLTEKLAIKPIIYYNLMKETIALNQFQNDRFVEVQDFRLQFGISYHY